MKVTGTITGRQYGRSIIDTYALDFADIEARANALNKPVELHIVAPTRFSEQLQEIIPNHVMSTVGIAKLDDVLSLFGGITYEQAPNITTVMMNLGIPGVVGYVTKTDYHDKQTRKQRLKGYSIITFEHDKPQLKTKYLTPKYCFGKQIYQQVKHMNWPLLIGQALHHKTRKLLTGGNNV